MKLSTYLLLTAIAISQWLIMELPGITPQFDTTTFFNGNMQMIMVLASMQLLMKMVDKCKVNE